MEQMQLFEPTHKKASRVSHTIYQPDTDLKPWAVHVEGWQGKRIDVMIYHENINQDGVARFYNLKLSTAQEFARFVVKMLDVFINAFCKPYIEVRPIDVLALEDGFRKEVGRR